MMKRDTLMTHCLMTFPLLCALFVGCAAPPDVSEIDEIVNSNLEARGGVERIRAVQSMRATGTATASGGRIAKVVQEIKRPSFYRLEFSSQGTKAVFAHDGEIGWQVAPRQGIFEPQPIRPEQDSEAGIDERDIEGHLVGWREKGHTVELVGRETLPSGEAFKLETTLADGGTRVDYIDVESRLIVRSDKTETIATRVLQMEETYSDFREVDGLVLPHRIETRVTNRPETITIVVESFELDPELDEDRFRMPE
jgi:outer membrane lipoprotein-sorting protein